MTLSHSKPILLLAAAAAACLFSVQAVRAQTFDTTSAWDGSGVIQYFGPTNPDPSLSDTPTYGETFIAPTGTTELNDFTFYFGSSDGGLTDNNGNFVPDVTGDQYNVVGEVFNWTGSLLGGNGPQGTTGAALYTSPAFTITSTGAYQAVTVTIPGGLNLTAGDDYVIDLTDVDATLPNSDFGIFAFDFNAPVAGDGGGGFAYSNIGEVGTWDDGADFGDLVFKADFSSPASGGGSSAPDGASTAGLLGLALAGLAMRSRRQHAVSQS